LEFLWSFCGIFAIGGLEERPQTFWTRFFSLFSEGHRLHTVTADLSVLELHQEFFRLGIVTLSVTIPTATVGSPQ